MVRFGKFYGNFIVFFLAGLLVLSGCGGGDKGPKPLAGGDFNKFFPEKEGSFKIVFTQEKKGMTQAKLKKDGKDIATLTIADLISNSGAMDNM